MDFCYFCQEKSEIVGHTYLNCPMSKCKECGVAGHIVKNCPVLMHVNDFRKMTQLPPPPPLQNRGKYFFK